MFDRPGVCLNSAIVSVCVVWLQGQARLDSDKAGTVHSFSAQTSCGALTDFGGVADSLKFSQDIYEKKWNLSVTRLVFHLDGDFFCVSFPTPKRCRRLIYLSFRWGDTTGGQRPSGAFYSLLKPWTPDSEKFRLFVEGLGEWWWWQFQWSLLLSSRQRQSWWLISDPFKDVKLLYAFVFVFLSSDMTVWGLGDLIDSIFCGGNLPSDFKSCPEIALFDKSR